MKFIILKKAVGHKYIKRVGAPGNYQYFYSNVEAHHTLPVGMTPEHTDWHLRHLAEGALTLQDVSEKKHHQITKREMRKFKEPLGTRFQEYLTPRAISPQLPRGEEHKWQTRGAVKERSDLPDFMQKYYRGVKDNEIQIKIPYGLLIKESNKAEVQRATEWLKNSGAEWKYAGLWVFRAGFMSAQLPTGRYYRDIVGEKVVGTDLKTGKKVRGVVNQVSEDGILVGLPTGEMIAMPFGSVDRQTETGELKPLHGNKNG